MSPTPYNQSRVSYPKTMSPTPYTQSRVPYPKTMSPMSPTSYSQSQISYPYAMSPSSVRHYPHHQAYHQGYQPQPVSSLPPQRSSSGMSAPGSFSQDLQEPDSGRQSRGWGQENHGRVRSRSSLGCARQESSHRQAYSPGQAPHVDTGYDAPTPYDTHKGSDTRSQLGEGIMHDGNEDPAPSGLPGRDIITMSELEDFAVDFGDDCD